MNQTITINNEIYAILVSTESVLENTEWFGHPIESLQMQRFHYSAGHTFKVHYHTLNPRTIKRTQEVFIVIKGRIVVDVYDNKANIIAALVAGPGDAVVTYRGGAWGPTP